MLCPAERSTNGAGGAPSCSDAVHPGDGLKLSAGSQRLLQTVFPQSQSEIHTSDHYFMSSCTTHTCIYLRLSYCWITVCRVNVISIRCNQGCITVVYVGTQTQVIFKIIGFTNNCSCFGKSNVCFLIIVVFVAF